MPGTYSPVADFKGNRYLQTVMHVGIAYPRWQGKRSRHSRRMRTHNCTYLARCGCQKQQNSYVNHLHQTSPEANWIFVTRTLQWRHNEHHGVSNHCCLDSLLGRLFRRRLKKTSKLPVTSFCEGSLPVTDGFPSQRASNTEKGFRLSSPRRAYIPNDEKIMILRLPPMLLYTRYVVISNGDAELFYFKRSTIFKQIS